MDASILLNSTPTACVRLLCEELLSDGKIHTRKEMEDYVESNLRLMGVKLPTSGCIAGGIRQAIHNKNCIKLGTAIYQAVLISDNMSNANRKEKAADCLNSAINTLTVLAHEIDYIAANDSEMEELNNLKNCIRDLLKWQKIIQENN